MQQSRGLRGDYFVDRLLGWTEVVLALVSFGIVLSRFRAGFNEANGLLAISFLVEAVGGLLIVPSKEPAMRAAFWIFVFRVAAGMAYMSVIHGDKLARSVLGFPFLFAIYCWVRLRALKANP